jgi:DNA repair protein RadC
MLSINECAERRRPPAMPALYIRVGDEYAPAPDKILLKHLRRWARDRFRPGAPVLEHPLLIEAFLLTKLSALEREVFAVILLDREYRLIEYIEMAQGCVTGVRVYSRDVVEIAIRHKASNVIFAHNHPSGRAEPSPEDIALTRRLRDALEYVDIRVMDHVIVGKTVTSFARRGLLTR